MEELVLPKSEALLVIVPRFAADSADNPHFAHFLSFSGKQV